MFGSARQLPRKPSTRPSVPMQPRGLATLRVYHHAPYPVGGIYEEPVLGGYRVAGGAAVIVTRGAGDDDLHLYIGNSKTGFVCYLGCMPSSVRAAYEETSVGGHFFLRNLRVQRLEKDELRACVYAFPVWYAEHPALGSGPSKERARVPSGARLFHQSIMLSHGAVPGQEDGVCPDLFSDSEARAPAL